MSRCLVVCAFTTAFVVLVAFPTTRAQAPAAAIYDIGDLPGGADASAVRDATMVGGVIYAVGGSVVTNTGSTPSLDTPTIWTSNGAGGGTLVALPEGTGITNTNTFFRTAVAITPDAAFIASQALYRLSNGSLNARWVRVQRSLLSALDPTTANLDLSTTSGGIFAMGAYAISDNGAVVYAPGNNNTLIPVTQTPRRWESGLGTNIIDVSTTGKTWGTPIPRGTSSDGSIMVGIASNGSIGGGSVSQGPFGYPVWFTNTTAFRYVHTPNTLTGTTTPIPMISNTNGAWSFPITMSSDGAVTVLAGNSNEFQNGEIYLTDASNTVTARLGSPNTGLTPRALGGRTADGAIVVTFHQDSVSQPTTIPFFSRTPYVHNSHGWFLLGSVLRQQGIDLELLGWNLTDMAVTSVRTVEGFDLITGQGTKGTFNPADGTLGTTVRRGFVIQLPAGALANFAAPVETVNEALVGAWTFVPFGGATSSNVVPVYFADGRYITFSQGTGTYQKGFEKGRYSWPTNGGTWYQTVEKDANAQFGQQGFSVSLGRSVTVANDTYRIINTRCAAGAISVQCAGLDASRVVGAPNSVVGAWTATVGAGQFGGTVFTGVFLGASQGNRYFVHYDNPALGIDELELGSYTYDGTDVTFSPEGDIPNANSATLSRDGLAMDIGGDNELGLLRFTRVVSRSTVVPVLTTPLAADATVGSPFSLTIPATYTLTFSSTTLPDGLSLDANSGVISGVPTTAGDVSVDVTATNTFGDTDVATLVIAVRANQAALIIGAPSSATYGSTFPVTIGGGSGTGAFSFGVTGGCTAAGSDVTMTSGTVDCTINAQRAGDSLYLNASGGQAVTAVTRAASVTPAAASKVYGQTDPTLTGSLAGFLAADGVSATYGRVAGETVTGGPYAISGTLSAGVGVLGNYNITGNTAPFTITTATTGATLASSPNPSSPGQPVNFVATVTGQYGGLVSGTVTFSKGQQVLGTAAVQPNGTATLPLSTLGVGSTVVTAVYGGDTNNITSTSPTATQTVVAPAASTTTTLASSLNPSIVGQSVTLTATVTSGTAGTITGTVDFRRGQTVLFTAPLVGGQATYATTTLPLGSSGLTAIYSGDAQYITSASAALTQVVSMAATTTTLGSSPNPSNGGAIVTLTATIASGTPGATTGTVTFKRGPTVLGTASVSGNQASMTTTTLPAGASNLTAIYSGDATYTGSTSAAVVHTVNTGTTTTALTSSLNPSTFGTSVTFTATVVSSLGTVPTGVVEFVEGGTTLGTATLVNGTATFAISTLSLKNGKTATHNIKAKYLGDAYHANSTSATLPQVVNP